MTESSGRRNSTNGQLYGDLRGLRAVGTRPDIECTTSLVAAFNREEDDSTRAVLHYWLSRYVAWFSVNAENCPDDETILEYSRLAEIEPRNDEDLRLLRRLFFSLCNHVDRIRFGEKASLQALNNVLEALNERVLKAEDAVYLIRLAHVLLKRVKPPQLYSEITYPVHSAALTAVCGIMVILKAIAPDSLNSRDRGIYQAFRNRLKDIAECQEYYPFLFETKLIEQGLQRLLHDTHVQAMRRVYMRLCHALTGMANVYHGARTLMLLDIKTDLLGKIRDEFRAAIAPDTIREKSWYEVVQLVTKGRMLSLREPTEFEDFKKCYSGALDRQSSMKKGEDRRDLRFGIISQLLQLTVDARQTNMLDFAVESLVDLAIVRTEEEDWATDFEILEALLKALATIHARGTHGDTVYKAFMALKSRNEKGTLKTRPPSRSQSTSELFEKIQKRLEDADSEDPCLRADGDCMGGKQLYLIVRKELGMIATHSDEAKHAEELRKKYLEQHFVEIPHFVQGEDGRHVRDLEHCLKVSAAPDEAFYDSNTGAEDQMASHYHRQRSERRSISMSEIFGSQASSSEMPPVLAHRVLIYGNPGTGKTSFSKKIPYAWATGQWGTEFKAVYMIPVRELTEENYHRWSPRRRRTLQTAVANIRFGCADSEESLNVLIEEIENRLENPTTLLILDGVDEADAVGRKMVKLAFQHRCKLLLLSRPYDLRNEREKVDLEIELVGLDDQQVKRFIRSDVRGEQGERLIKTLKKEQCVWEIAHVPVNANIICFVWKNREDRPGMMSLGKGLLGLYEEITLYLSLRYSQGLGLPDVDRLAALKTLERIAYNAVAEHKILIREYDVVKYTGSSILVRHLERAGFLSLSPISNAQYRFPHLTFQEYFASQYLARSLREDPECRTLDRRNAEAYIGKHKYCEVCQFTFKLMTLELSTHRESVSFCRLRQIVDSEPLELIGVQQFFLKLRLLDDFLSGESNRSIRSLGGDASMSQLVDSAVSLLRCSSAVQDFQRQALKNMKQLPNVSRLLLEKAPEFFGDEDTDDDDGVVAALPTTAENDQSRVEINPDIPSVACSREFEEPCSHDLIEDLELWFYDQNADRISSIVDKLLQNLVILEKGRGALNEGFFFFRAVTQCPRDNAADIEYPQDRIKTFLKETKRALEEKMPNLYSIPDLQSCWTYLLTTPDDRSESVVARGARILQQLVSGFCCCKKEKGQHLASVDTTAPADRLSPPTCPLGLDIPRRKPPSSGRQKDSLERSKSAPIPDHVPVEFELGNYRTITSCIQRATTRESVTVKSYDSVQYEEVLAIYRQINRIRGVCRAISTAEQKIGRRRSLVFERGSVTLSERLEHGSWTKDEKKDTLRQILEAVRDMQKQDIVHGDINPDNIMFFKKTRQWKLSEFDYATLSGLQIQIRTLTSYTAPEIVTASRKRKKAIKADCAMDIWSLGVIAFELILGEPFRSHNQTIRSVDNSAVLEKQLSKIERLGDEDATHLLKQLLQMDPENRWSAAEALESDYFVAGSESKSMEILDPACSTQVKKRSQRSLLMTPLESKESNLANLIVTCTIDYFTGRRVADSDKLLRDEEGKAARELWGSELLGDPVFVVPSKGEILGVKASCAEGQDVDLLTAQTKQEANLCEAVSLLPLTQIRHRSYSPVRPLGLKYTPLDLEISFRGTDTEDIQTIRKRIYLMAVSPIQLSVRYKSERALKSWRTIPQWIGSGGKGAVLFVNFALPH